jgi:quinol monooxygenase YgiN
MKASNIVRFKVQPGHEAEFIRIHEEMFRGDPWPGMEQSFLVRTGEGQFCIVGLWADQEALAAARPAMIATLDRFRHLLEDLRGGRGVTDPASGPVVASFPPARGAIHRPSSLP